MKRNYLHIFLSLAALCLLLPGCADELPGASDFGEYPEGETPVRVSLDFEPFAASASTTRSLPGKTLDQLDDLCLVAYDSDGNLMEGFPVRITSESHGLTVTSKDRGDADASNGFTAEKQTRHAEFTITLPYGRYYLYALSNLGKRDASGKLVTDTYTALQSDELAKSVLSRRALLAHKAQWDSENPYNNFEMLGFFCNSEESKSPSTGETTNDRTVSIRTPSQQIHCWLRRCVAKVTVDFDGSQLLENIYVYVRRVTLHDIPSSCSLGDPNAASSRSELISGKNSGWNGPENGENYRPLNADYIDFGKGSDHDAWPKISRGAPYLTDEAGNRLDLHSETADALFLYENMQGESLDDKTNKLQTAGPDGLVVGADEEKDLMACGSYIEVEAYYDRASATDVSQGKIYYRFMLGKDELKNFDVERNHHYKITMAPRGNGNDVDWHIEYSVDDGFEFRDPYFVSYLYNHESTLHFRYVPPEGRKVVTLKAEIVGNNWWPDDESAGILTASKNAQRPFATNAEEADPFNAPYLHNRYSAADAAGYTKLVGRTKYLGNGFLSLRATSETNILMNRVTDYNTTPEANWAAHEETKWMNDLYFYGAGFRTGDTINRGERIYYFDSEGHPDMKDKSNSGREAYNVEKYPDGSLRFNIPVFTRAKNIVKETAYSGNNPYEGSERSAFIRLTAILDDGTPKTQVVRVQQVKRITNPKGIYRRAGNNEDFHVRLMELSSPGSDRYVPIESEGPWMAEVIGGAGFITLNGRNIITGATGSDIDFRVIFNKLNKDNKVRNAVIRVRYNNYTCVHLIFVRQGYDAQELFPGSPQWETRNLVYGTRMADDPRDEGSLFKLGNLTQPIDVKSNPPYDNPQALLNAASFTIPSSFYIAKSDGSEPAETDKLGWTDITSASHVANNWHYTGNSFIGSGIATVEHYQKFYQTDYLVAGFGVLYADGATEVAESAADACGWYRHDKNRRDAKGMRGVFMYYWNASNLADTYNCRNLFFPIGRSGYGHRRAWDRSTLNAGVLRYAVGRDAEMPSTASPWTPQFFDLYRRQGAIYWGEQPIGGIRDAAGTELKNWDNGSIAVALDLNYYTFDVSCLPASNLQKHSMWSGCADSNCIDACFLRMAK